MLCWQVWKQHAPHCASPSELLGDQVHSQWAVILKGIFSSEQQVSIVGLKYSVSHVINRCAVIQALLLWRTGRVDSIILKGPRIFRIRVLASMLAALLTAMLAPNNRVSLSFEALKPGIDFSSLAMKVLDGIFFPQKAVHVHWKFVV